MESIDWEGPSSGSSMAPVNTEFWLIGSVGLVAGGLIVDWEELGVGLAVEPVDFDP